MCHFARSGQGALSRLPASSWSPAFRTAICRGTAHTRRRLGVARTGQLGAVHRGQPTYYGAALPLTINWTTLFLSIVLQIPLLWTDKKVMASGLDAIGPSDWLAMLYLIVFATALGQQAWLYGVRGVGPSRAGVFVELGCRVGYLPLGPHSGGSCRDKRSGGNYPHLDRCLAGK